MRDDTNDPGREDLKTSDGHSVAQAAAEAMRQDYLDKLPNSVGKTNSAAGNSEPISASGSASPKSSDSASSENKSSGAASPPTEGSSVSAEIVLRPNEKRMSEERLMFRSRYQEQNVDLVNVPSGGGPFQALEQLVKDGKLKMTTEELVSESKRIRDRDFKEWGRDYYNTTDHVKLWSDQEIDERVNLAVKRIKGIDVSAHQGDVDWKKVKEAGYEFAFLKATEGGDWVDSKFAENRKGALEAGLAVGYYHYFRPPRPVEDQIQNFVKTVGKLESNSLRLVIDTEDEKMWKPYTIDQRIKMIDDWCKGVQKELGVTPQITIYSSPNFFNEVLKNSPELAKYSLWIANYNVAEPTIPKPWSKWDFWQYSDKGTVPGIDNKQVDLNMFHGDDLTKTPGIRARKR